MVTIVRVGSQPNPSRPIIQTCLVTLYAQVVVEEIAGVKLRRMYIHILLIQALRYAVVVWVQMQA